MTMKCLCGALTEQYYNFFDLHFLFYLTLTVTIIQYLHITHKVILKICCLFLNIFKSICHHKALMLNLLFRLQCMNFPVHLYGKKSWIVGKMRLIWYTPKSLGLKKVSYLKKHFRD